MRNRNEALIAVAVIACVASAYAAVESYRRDQRQNHRPHLPPSGALRMAKFGITGHDYSIPAVDQSVQARAQLGPDGEISVLWTFGKAEPDKTWSSPLLAEDQSYPSNSSITAFHFLPDGRLLVGGADQDGAPYCEAWSFRPPEIRGLDGPPSSVTMVAGHLESRDPVFSHATDPYVTYAQCFLTGGALASNTVLMLTYPSSILYQLDLSTGFATAIASPGASIGAFAPVSALALAWESAGYIGRHANFGHCYLLRPFSTCNFATPVSGLEGLLLFDSDANGALDGFLELPVRGSASAILNDPSKWIY